MAFRMVVILFLSIAWSSAQTAPTSQDLLESIISEVESLKRTVSEQERRILRLEKLVRQLSSADGPTRVLSSSQTKRPTTGYRRPGFRPKENWHRIKNGMSTSQVIDILGKPTRMEDIDMFGYHRLFYSGEVPGSGSVSGNVKLKDDQVWDVNIPYFEQTSR